LAGDQVEATKDKCNGEQEERAGDTGTSEKRMFRSMKDFLNMCIEAKDLHSIDGKSQDNDSIVTLEVLQVVAKSQENAK